MQLVTLDTYIFKFFRKVDSLTCQLNILELLSRPLTQTIVHPGGSVATTYRKKKYDGFFYQSGSSLMSCRSVGEGMENNLGNTWGTWI